MTRNPNPLLVAIMLLLLVIVALLVVRDNRPAPAQAADISTPTATPAPTPTATPLPVDEHSDGIPIERANARLVFDSHCPTGQGWQWLEPVPDGMGNENLIIKGACSR